MAPYAFAAVGLGFVFFFTHLILRKMQNKKDFVWNRQPFTYRKLPLAQKRILETYPFYLKLSKKYKKEFEHRMAAFIKDKDFKHRYEPQVSDAQIVYTTAVAIQLSFGRANYLYSMINTVLFFEQAFQSPTNEAMHKGEYNPRAKVLAMSWEDFLKGMVIDNDNLHLGLHEFMHVMHFESKHSTDVDSVRFHKYEQKILRHIMKPEVRERLDRTKYFRAYAFTNEYEFLSVLTEYFFESPADFKAGFPVLFEYFKTALLFKDEWIFEV
ncbi:MAG: zinc-dependent peptidase [Nonlabens sp.]|uniref:zinc-dependent peptidase n=1 Tax=Nonlabens sp. TaxID=1888209 RepID=UPI003EFA684E